ncbi:MAG: DUF58 domain-containing protein [Planctomycetes bacterium]|nr:DUF58 domain-containing protein [Planctomycetota bacterium]
MTEAGARTTAAARGGPLTFVPTRRLALLLLLPLPVILLGGGSAASAGAALAVDLVLLVLAAVEALRLPGPAAVLVSRPARSVLSLGSRTALEVEVRLPAGAGEGAVVALQEDLPAEVRPASRPAPARIEAGGAARFLTEVVALRRGRFPLGGVHLRLSGRLGLALRQYAVEEPAEVRVLPNLAGVTRYRLLALRGRLREAGLRHLRLRGAGTAFESLREHLPGEDRRRVDWKATARRGRLIARNYQVERSQSVVLLVDAGRLMTAEVDRGFPRLEHALNAALVLAHVAASREDRVGALVFADRVQGFVPPARGRGALERVTAVLAAADGRLVEPDVEGAFRHLAARGRKRSLLVLFTEVVDPEVSAAVLAHAARAAGRHVALVVTLRDLALEAAARGRDGSGDPWRRAAAEELLHGRDQALAMLRGRGVSVLDADPAALTSAVVDRYLELKARMLI